MTPVRTNWIAVASFAAGVIGAITLVILSISAGQLPLGPPAFNEENYSLESESLFGSASWLNYSFHGVTFGFHLWCSVSVDVGVVCGHATESSGASYAYNFSDGPPGGNPSWATWLAPDDHEAVQYKDGGLVQLFVSN
jgi:hypothetical protein